MEGRLKYHNIKYLRGYVYLSIFIYFPQRLAPGKVYQTRASLLRGHQVPVEGPGLWKMSKFDRKVGKTFEFLRTWKKKM